MDVKLTVGILNKISEVVDSLSDFTDDRSRKLYLVAFKDVKSIDSDAVCKFGGRATSQ